MPSYSATKDPREDSQESRDPPREKEERRRSSEIREGIFGRRRRGTRANSDGDLTCTEISTVHLHTKTRIEDLRHRNALIRVLVYRAFVSSFSLPRLIYRHVIHFFKFTFEESPLDRVLM